MRRRMRKFLPMVMQGWQRNVTNGALHVRTCFFACCLSNLSGFSQVLVAVAVVLAKAPQ